MKNKELETWLSETKAKNLSLDELKDFTRIVESYSSIELFTQLKAFLKVSHSDELAKHLFNQWQKEAEFSPKRGDRVLVDYKEKIIEIIDEKIKKLETLKSLLIAEL